VSLVELLLLLELELLLVSAFRRVALYEAAYGYTTARLCAQIYMAVVGLMLIRLAAERRRPLDVGRLGRHLAMAGALALAALTFWNHEA
jgi:hypothetical protein